VEAVNEEPEQEDVQYTTVEEGEEVVLTSVIHKH